jgi:S1-C subfamily serine protease
VTCCLQDVTILPSEYRDFVTFGRRALSTRLLPVAAVAAALLLAGCGGSGPGGSAPTPGSTDSGTTASASTGSTASTPVPHLGIVLGAPPAGESGVLVRSLLRKGVRSLLRPGDLIVVVNGTRARSAAQVSALLHRQGLGDRLTLTVRRGSRRLRFSETLSPSAYLGAQVQGRNRVAVIAVAPRSPAAAAGLMPGDAIVAIDGRAVHDAPGVLAVLATRHPGEQVRVEVVRGSRRLLLTATLGERP